MKNLCKAAEAFGFITFFLCQACLLPASAAPVPSSQQEFLAAEYRLKVSQATDAEEREALYLRLIDECPETELAEESYWALSNIYLDDFEEPKEDKAKEILESFLERYPESRWTSHVKSRLQWLRGEISVIPY